MKLDNGFVLEINDVFFHINSENSKKNENKESCIALKLQLRLCCKQQRNFLNNNSDGEHSKC